MRFVLRYGGVRAFPSARLLFAALWFATLLFATLLFATPLFATPLFATPFFATPFLATGVAAASAPMPGVDNPARAKVNYMLNCQGCHGPDGAGTADGAVPTMKDFVGNFLAVEGGRAFLVRVPGSANSALGNRALAEVLNWMLWQLSPAQIPLEFQPYTEAEVALLRARPLQDVAHVRATLLEKLSRL